MRAPTELTKGMLHRAVFDGLVAGFGATVAIMLLWWSSSAPSVSSAEVFGMIAAFGIASASLNYFLGLYSTVRTYSFRTKLGYILGSSAILLVVCLALLALATLTTPVFYAVLLGCCVAASIQSLARYSAELVRREKVQEFNQRMSASGKSNDEKKVLVIGGAGYIGSALVPKLLERGFHVRVLDVLGFGQAPIAGFANHPNCQIIRADFRNIEDLIVGTHGVGTVVHLGGLVGDPACAVNEEMTVDINVTATKIIGQIAKAQGVKRFIFASSCSVYGANDLVVDESSVFNPQSLYARTKVAGEAVLRQLADDSFVPTFLRFATIYGVSGRTRFDLVVNLLTAKAIKDKKITVFGSDQWRPFVHVDDIASAVVRVIEAPRHLVDCEAFNVGSDDQNYTLGDMAEVIKSHYPDASIVIDDTFVDRRNYRVSFEKINSVLGFEPQWTLDAGIAQMGELINRDMNIDYNDPSYSNVKFLQSYGSKIFEASSLTGWEESYMNIDALSQSGRPASSVAPKAS